MNFNEMTTEQLHAVLDQLDAERLSVRERARQARAALDQKLAEEAAADHGLTLESYQAARSLAREQGVPFSMVIAHARRAQARGLQVAQALPAMIGVQGKNTSA
jgi:hypothetical protein